AGLRVGAGLGNVSTPVIIDLIAPDFQYIPGIELGVIGEYRVNDRIAIMGEVNFREKGFRMSENMEVGLFGIDVPLGVRVDTRLRYLDMPIQFKYNLGRGPVQAYVSAGPQLGYAMNGRVKTKANFLIDWNLTNTPINLDAINYRRFEAGATMGAGVEFANGPGKIFADVRYYQGFTDSFRLPIAQLDIKNHGFGFGVGYKISL
ncbi:MAG: PorT family protein, partial [Saprospiraceae bacterium]|nr:PorT family protein [Saprospiraceae bacterium]